MLVTIGNITKVVPDNVRGGLFDEHCRTAVLLACVGGNFWIGPDAGTISLVARGALNTMAYGLRSSPLRRKDLNDYVTAELER